MSRRNLGRSWVSSRSMPSFHEEDVNPASYGADDDATFGASTIRTDDASDDVARLYVICEMAMPRVDEPPVAEMSAKELAQRQEHLAETWDLIREWLTAHPDPQDRNLAATHLGQFSMTALHLLCKLPDPPPDVVESMIGCSPETVTWQDSNGWLPLHHACANGASGEVLSILCGSYPEGKVAQDRRQRTPLHFAFFRSDVGGKEDGAELERDDSMAEIVAILSDTGAAQLPDEGGMLPMHYACAYGTTTPVLEVLERAFPASTSTREKKGRTPLHLAMVNAHRSAGPGVVRFLLEMCPKDVVDMTDDSGFLPLHLLAVVSKSRPDKPEARANATECLKSYLSAQPRPTPEFLQAVQSLPEWLCDHAVTSPHVHHVLNDKIVQRFPTSILMLDMYMKMLLIVVFSLNAKWHIDYRFDPDVDTIPSSIPLYFQFIGGSYFLAREIAQVVSMAALGTVRKWLVDPENWLDVTVIFLVFYYAAIMTDPAAEMGVNNELFRSGVAATQGVLWTSIIIFLKSTLVDFAVFVGGVVYVFRQLVAFMVSLAVILFAFAEMFYFVFSMTPVCPRNETTGELGNPWDYPNPHCTFERSLLKTYTMMMGEIGDVTRYYEENLVSQILYVLYAFLVVILLSNILIAIVVDSYGVIKNERAAMVFWSNRLDFVAEMDAISNAVNMSGACRAESGAPGAPAQVQEVPGGEGIATSERWRGGGGTSLTEVKNDYAPFRDGWSALASLFDPNLYKENDITPGSFDFWCYFLLRIVAIFVIPLWLLVGLATAGWLWPPQVREWLFVQSRAAISRADIAEGVRNEVLKLREELKGLRIELKSEMKTDRKEIANMKAEVDAVQTDILSDLTQVKDIMTTLFELTREKKREREERASAAAIAAARG